MEKDNILMISIVAIVAIVTIFALVFSTAPQPTASNALTPATVGLATGLTPDRGPQISNFNNDGPCGFSADFTKTGNVTQHDLVFLQEYWGDCPYGNCKTDLTCSGDTNVHDILALLDVLGTDGALVPQSAADLNNDGVVNIHDLLLLLDNWHCSSNCAQYDLNNDGNIDDYDLLILLNLWGTVNE